MNNELNLFLICLCPAVLVSVVGQTRAATMSLDSNKTHGSSSPPGAPQSAPAAPPRSLWQPMLVLAGTVLLTVALLFVPVDAVERLGALGYVGVFVLTLLASASIVLPSPALGVALLAGRTLDPWLVGLLSGVAAGLGEITGYVAGYSGSTLAQHTRWYARVAGWVERWGALTVFALAALPSPLIDLAGIAAGTMRMRFRVYLAACLLGKVLRFTAVAWLGRWLGWSFL